MVSEKKKDKQVIRTRIALIKLNFQVALETEEPLDKAVKVFNELVDKYEKKR